MARSGRGEEWGRERGGREGGEGGDVRRAVGVEENCPAYSHVIMYIIHTL